MGRGTVAQPTAAGKAGIEEDWVGIKPGLVATGRP